ncbi:MAG: choice-of-anchor E domain-containing protein [Sedimentisphaerales bacterium]
MDSKRCIVGEKTGKHLFLDFKTTFLLFAAFTTTVSIVIANPLIQKQTFFSEIPNFSTLLTFDKFSAGGTLASVRITIQLQINGGTLIIDNDGDSDVSGTVEFGIFGNADSIEVNLPLLGREAFCSQPFYLGSNVGDGIGDYDPSPPDGMQFTGGSNSGTVSAFVEDKFLNNYIGTGTYNIAVGIIQLVNCDNTNIEYSIVTPITTSGFIEVAYNVPEPATICLLAVGAWTLLKRKG